MKTLEVEERAILVTQLKTRMGVDHEGWGQIVESPLYPLIMEHALYGNWGYVAILVTEVERGIDR